MTQNQKTDSSLSRVLGIGNDIVEINRIRNVFRRHPARFLSRLLTPNEQAYCLKCKDPAGRLASRFAAKEAVAKAMGTGFGQFLSWLDIEITHDASGKPQVLLSKPLLEKYPNTLFHLSISHCREYATAVAVWVYNIEKGS